MLDIHELETYYDKIRVLHGVSLHIDKGEIVALIGSNGAGKTTLLNTISGLVRPRSGSIYFKNRAIHTLNADQIVRAGISQVPERRQLFRTMTVQENLELGAFSLSGERDKQRIKADIANVKNIFPVLAQRSSQVAGTLSGGEQQMLAIARGLMARPKLLMLDEPSLGLAPKLIKDLIQTIYKLKELGTTILLVEQQASGALRIADRGYLLDRGVIQISGSGAELIRNPRVQNVYLGREILPNEHRLPDGVTLASSLSDEQNKSDGKSGILAKRTREKVISMKSEPSSQYSFTLPDSYFEQRIGYSRSQILKIQEEAFPIAVQYAFSNSSFYREKMRAHGLTPEAIRSLGDLPKLPFTSSDELQSSSQKQIFTDRFVAVSAKNVSLVHTSSGTTGSPKVFPYTGVDIANWASNVATVFWLNGFRKSDHVLGVMPFGEFTGGGGLYLGMIALGASYIPISLGPGVTDKVMAHLTGLMQMNDLDLPLDPLLQTNGLICLGSFLPRLEEMLDQFNVHPDDLVLTKISAGAEPSSDAVRMRIAERFGIWPKDNYGLGEFYGPGVAGECESGGGLHVLSDCFIAEVIDPESDEKTPPGKMGELVLTSLQKEAVPLLRYRTGDRVLAMSGECPCGCAHTWIGRVPGRIRVDDLMIPGGIIVNRTFLEDIILRVNGTGTQYVVTVADHPSRKGLKRLRIALEGDADAGLEELIAHRIRVEYNHSPLVTVLPYGAIKRELKKAKRILTPFEFQSLLSENGVKD
jgi:ABC-type branched-subunit amino acid transport system ATPase component/phenylacetate-coenzyme A ligase PaaK-like adenylate-forming protein